MERLKIKVLLNLVKILTGILLLIFAANPVFAQREISESGSVVELVGPCGHRPISIARMQWASSIILAHIHAQILQQEFGCSVQVVGGDMAATVSSMATTGHPAIVPELWATRIASIWNSVLESGHVRSEALTFSADAIEGWFLPAQLADKMPGLKSVAELKDSLALFLADDASIAQGERIKFISCPVDWACSVINRNLIIAYGLEDVLELVEPANRFEMDILIARAVSRNQPVVFYYWQPNAILAQFDFVSLDMGRFEGEKFKCLAQRACETPEPSSFAPEKAFIVVSDWVAQEAPLVSQYLRRAVFPLAEMNLILSWESEGDADFQMLAARFVAERRDVWSPWVEGLL